MTQSHYEHFVERARRTPRLFGFDERWRQDPQRWRRQWQEKLLELLGPWPASCEPQPQWQLLEKRPRYTLQRVTYFTEPGLQTFAFVGVPHDLPSGGAPGVLCLHGHGKFGAHAVMAVREQEGIDEEIAKLMYDFGDRFAQAGAVVLAPNHRGFGQRLTDIERKACTDPCDRNFAIQMLLGEVAITSQLHDLKVALDILSGMPAVRRGAIGCAGLSYGGRLTKVLSAIEPRIRAAVVSGALNAYMERVEDYKPCGYQIIPGLLRHGDTAEILGLIAPRPLLLERGDTDPVSPPRQAQEEFERLQRIYQAFDAADRLQLVTFAGGHQFHGQTAIPWLLGQLGKEH